MFVEDLWMPEHTPPQLTPKVTERLRQQIQERGAIEVAIGALSHLQDNQRRLDTYLDEFGFDLNKRSTDVCWPIWALRLGAALATLGYEYSGQSIDVEKTFDLSCELAEMQGIPEAYATSMYSDQGLQDVIKTAFEDSRLTADDGQGLLQVSIIGAGCVRFYLQEALLAA